MTATPLYASPRQVASIDECFFYHFMDLPGVGTVGSTWDLRSCTDQYLGGEDYRGKRVLDVGAASGYLTFEMERRGAEVVSFDLASVQSWNFVPHYAFDGQWQKLVASRATCHRQMQNAYWFAHERFRSAARVHYGDVYDLPRELGNFDIVYLGMILPHLRDPFQALYSASRLALDQIIVTNPGRKPTWLRRWLGYEKCQAKFLPSAENRKCDVWWALSSSCIERMLEPLGFRVVRRVPATGICMDQGRPKKRKNLAIVAQRVAGQAEGAAMAGQTRAA